MSTLNALNRKGAEQKGHDSLSGVEYFFMRVCSDMGTGGSSGVGLAAKV